MSDKIFKSNRVYILIYNVTVIRGYRSSECFNLGNYSEAETGGYRHSSDSHLAVAHREALGQAADRNTRDCLMGHSLS